MRRLRTESGFHPARLCCRWRLRSRRCSRRSDRLSSAPTLGLRTRRWPAQGDWHPERCSVYAPPSSLRMDYTCRGRRARPPGEQVSARLIQRRAARSWPLSYGHPEPKPDLRRSGECCPPGLAVEYAPSYGFDAITRALYAADPCGKCTGKPLLTGPAALSAEGRRGSSSACGACSRPRSARSTDAISRRLAASARPRR